MIVKTIEKWSSCTINMILHLNSKCHRGPWSWLPNFFSDSFLKSHIQLLHKINWLHNRIHSNLIGASGPTWKASLEFGILTVLRIQWLLEITRENHGWGRTQRLLDMLNWRSTSCQEHPIFKYWFLILLQQPPKPSIQNIFVWLKHTTAQTVCRFATHD